MVKEFWYNTTSNIDMMQGQCEGLILIEIDENNIRTVIYGNGSFGHAPYYKEDQE